MSLEEALNKYLDKFGEGFPMIPLAWGKSNDEVAKIVQRCIKKKKTAEQMGLIKYEDDVKY